jgi:hypothetical protein
MLRGEIEGCLDVQVSEFPQIVAQGERLSHNLIYHSLIGPWLGPFQDNGMVHVPDAASGIMEGERLDPLDAGRMASSGTKWGRHLELLAPKAQIKDDPSLAVVDKQGVGDARHATIKDGWSVSC